MRLPIGIYHQAGEVVFFGRRRRGKDIPGTRWAAITAPAQRALLEAGPLELLEYSGGRIRRRLVADLRARAQAELEAEDMTWIESERQAALVEVLVAELNKLGANPPATAGGIQSAYQARLTTSRGS